MLLLTIAPTPATLRHLVKVINGHSEVVEARHARGDIICSDLFLRKAATADIKDPALTGLADECKAAFRGYGAIVVDLRTAARTSSAVDYFLPTERASALTKADICDRLGCEGASSEFNFGPLFKLVRT